MAKYFTPHKSLASAPRPISLDATWEPLDSQGRSLAIYEAYDTMVEEDKYPPSHDRRWAKSNFKSLFKKYPGAVDAIWENIVAIWRLETLQDLEITDIWRHHAMSWLVSCAHA